MTPIHNHNSWAIVGAYRGRDLYQKWRRIHAGNEAGNAQVELIEEHVLDTGEALSRQRLLKIFMPSKAMAVRQSMKRDVPEPIRLENHGYISIPHKILHILFSAERNRTAKPARSPPAASPLLRVT